MHVGMTVTSHSPGETLALGAALAPSLGPGDVISLSGDLGAGKTIFVKGLASALGVDTPVTSPSFTLVNEYTGRHRIVHLDVYRLSSIQEVLDLGFEELLDPSVILIIEWGTVVAPLLPSDLLDIELQRSSDPDAEQDRIVLFRPRGPAWARRLELFREAMA
jgi:tRNA threonylcarbamoyladenosine biosynthesis protein TsaE